MPKVSIIIPFNNCDLFLEDLLSSLIKQTLKDIEIILVDDGSTDESVNIIKEYQAKDNRIKYIYQEQQGSGIARNNGIENAQGEYIICIDADDMYELDMMEKLYNKAKKTNADITICKFKRCDILTGRVSGGKGLDMRKIPKTETFSVKDVDNIFQIINPGPCNKLYKRDFIKENNLKYSGTRIINDLKFCMVAMCLAERIAIVDEDLSTYRYQISGSGSENREQRLEHSLKVYREIYDEFCARGLFEKYKMLYISRIIDSIKYEMTFEIPEKVLVFIKDFLNDGPLNILSKKDKQILFNMKKIRKQCFEYTLLVLLTLGLNTSLRYKLRNYRRAFKNIKYLLS